MITVNDKIFKLDTKNTSYDFAITDKGHAEHIHANCDCEFAIRFDKKSGVKGYDPDKYKRQYENAEGDTWRDKLNSIRRDQYEEAE